MLVDRDRRPNGRGRISAILRLGLRYLRRPVVLVCVLAAILLLSTGLRGQVHGVWQPVRSDSEPSATQNLIPYKAVENLILTVTKTRSVVVQSTTTRTVLLPAATDGGALARSLDAFGFPIYAPDESPQPHEAVTSSAEAGESMHFYRSDGLLEVNPDGPHPIFELMERAEREWEAKHAKASKTLKEACAEYVRRYGRNPPKGFARWWAYVKKHAVQLPDEYDQIHHDLEPFWAIEPLQLQWIQWEWESRTDSFTLGKENADDPISLLNQSDGTSMQMQNEIDKGVGLYTTLLKEVEHELPPFRAVFSPYDNPALLTDWELREEAIAAASRGEYLDLTKPREPKLHGWKTACPPLSPIWLDPLPTSIVNGVKTPPTLRQLEKFKFTSPNSNYSSNAPAYPKTFIHNHAASFSPCDHPSHILLHGQYLSFGSSGPTPLRARLSELDDNGQVTYYGLAPFFSYSPSTLHSDIVSANPMGWVAYPDAEDDQPFEDKPDSRLQWRGRNTGVWSGNDEQLEKMENTLRQISQETPTDEKLEVGPDRAWWLAQRGRLVDWANRIWETPDEVDYSTLASTHPRLGVPHEVWPRPRTIQDSLNAGLNLRELSPYALTLPRSIPASNPGVLRSPPSAEHRLAVGPRHPDVPDDAQSHESERLLKTEWAPALADIAFVERPFNCEGRACKKLEDMYEFKTRQHGTREQGRYKFVFDVDGNAWSSRFKKLITTNACIFKSTIYPEWFTDRIQPWLHFVPIQLDLSDLLDTLYFFRGDPSHQNHHLPLAAKIARAGRDWSKAYWRKEDLVAYQYRLFLEYARVMGDESGAREDYVYREEDEYSVSVPPPLKPDVPVVVQDPAEPERPVQPKKRAGPPKNVNVPKDPSVGDDARLGSEPVGPDLIL